MPMFCTVVGCGSRSGRDSISFFWFLSANKQENKLDLSGQSLKKIPKTPSPETANKVTELHLDNNELNKLENIAQFPNIVELSVTHNRLPKMYTVSPLRHIVKLDLSHNTIVSIEGLKELSHLCHLNLSSNKIKNIDNLQTNVQLEHLDLSENLISSISNISQLTKLKKLFLHKNMIVQLRHCQIYLPASLEALTLAANKISDLNEISNLRNFQNLKDLSIVSNPCVQMTGNAVGFDYRPFLLNWCTGLKNIDGYAVGDLECLKGEWLYSQGRGRQFRLGQHAELVQYLVETCSLNNENLQSENERKLRLILSKAHHHQSQLRMSEQPGPSSLKQSRSSISEMMTRSLDPTLLDSCSTDITDHKNLDTQSVNSLSRSLHCEPVSTREIEKMTSYAAPTPLPAASKLVPVPESLISPMVTNTPPLVMQTVNNNLDTVSPCKLQTIKNKAQQKRDKRASCSDKEQAAICIQKMWRGYHTRNLNPKVLSVYQHLQTRRTYQYIQKLSEDMEATRAALDNEHKLQLLQMQAINALYKKVISLQPAKFDESLGEVKDLAQTCVRLNTQVQQLQSCMQEVLRCVSPSSGSAMATQTDIVAVHTPNTEANETRFLHNRPSSLPLPLQNIQSNQNERIDGLADFAIKEPVSHDLVPEPVTEDPPK